MDDEEAKKVKCCCLCKTAPRSLSPLVYKQPSGAHKKMKERELEEEELGVKPSLAQLNQSVVGQVIDHRSETKRWGPVLCMLLSS